jgi:hypothetical protein
MSLYDTSGGPVGLCDRCRRRYPLSLLNPDGDQPSLRVCASCCDERDPYKNPARAAEDVSLRNPRPEENLT